MDNKKIITIIGIALVVVLLIVGCFVGGNDKTTTTTTKELSNDPQEILNNAQKESEEASKGNQEEFNQINADTYLEYLNGDEQKLVLVARPTCGYCQIAEPILKKIVSDYGTQINYLNTDDFSEDDTAKFISSDSEFSEGFGTPMLLVVGNKKIIDKVDGLTDTAHYIEFLKNYKFIK